MASGAKKAYKNYQATKKDREDYQALHSKTTMESIENQAKLAQYMESIGSSHQASIDKILDTLDHASNYNQEYIDHLLNTLSGVVNAIGH